MQTPVRTLSSNIVTAFSPQTLGTKVTDHGKFWEIAEQAIAAFDFENQKVPGQGFIPCNDLVPYLSAGVGRRTDNPDDYVVRLHRGRVDAYLRREKAAACTGAAIIAYTREAYLADPEVQKNDREWSAINESGCSFVLVAVLGFTEAKPALSPHRLVANLAGGNREALEWTAAEIRSKAEECIIYDNEWSVVSD